MEYENPIIRGFNPDPSICYDGEYYYLVTSSFEYYPGIPVYRSQDLVNWRQVGNVLEKQRTVDLSGIKNSQGLFAPTIRFHQGNYYVVCTNVTQGNFIANCSNAMKGLSYPVWVDAPTGIDPSLTFVNHHCYMCLAASKRPKEDNEIIMFEVNPDNGQVLSKIKKISKGCGGRDPEGPHIYHLHDHFYLIMAEGGTREGHMESLLN